MIKKGDIVLFSNNTFVSKVIKITTGDYFTHCGIAINEEKIMHLNIKGLSKNEFETMVSKSRGYAIFRTTNSFLNQIDEEQSRVQQIKNHTSNVPNYFRSKNKL